MPIVYIPIGPPASGKSTYGEHLVNESEITKTAIVSPDHYRAVLTDDLNDQGCNHPVFRLVEEIIKQRMKRQLDVYLDATNCNARLLDELLLNLVDWDEWNEYEFHFLIFSHPLSTLFQRNKDRSKTVPEDVIVRMNKNLAAAVNTAVVYCATHDNSTSTIINNDTYWSNTHD